MLELYFSNQFKKDYKTIKKRKLPIEKIGKGAYCFAIRKGIAKHIQRPCTYWAMAGL